MERFFISYNHEDVVKVKSFALLLSRHDFHFWMDEKDISHGDNHTTRILSAIHDSDAYLVFLSKSSINAPWVKAEIDFALQEKINRHLIIIPVLLEDVEIPVSLSNIIYLDARYSIQEAVDDLAKRYKKKEMHIDEIAISSISFTISEETSFELGTFTDDSISLSDLVEDRNRILSKLRKKAYGILMNFVSVDNFDFYSDSPTPKFSNGLYEEKIEKISGAFEGGVKEKITVDITVFNPNTNKLSRLLNDRLEIFEINSICFGLSIPTRDGKSVLELAKHCIQRIQDEYTILSYDFVEGAKIELKKDFYLYFAVSEETFRIKLSTKYGFQFEKYYKDFSVFDFVQNLLT